MYIEVVSVSRRICETTRLQYLEMIFGRSHRSYFPSAARCGVIGLLSWRDQRQHLHRHRRRNPQRRSQTKSDELLRARVESLAPHPSPRYPIEVESNR